jgi:hypothetical protein
MGSRRTSSVFRSGAVCLAAVSLASCKTIDTFDTGPSDAYCGRITGAPFVREDFDRQLQLQLRLRIATLNSVPGNLTTDDSDIGPCAPKALFSDAILRAPKKLESDHLSAFSFDEGSLTNFLAWVDSTCDGTYLAVVSLMQDNSVEVRLLRGALDSGGQETGPFGVFNLQRASGGCGFANAPLED